MGNVNNLDTYISSSVNEIGLLLLNDLQPIHRATGPGGRVFLTFPPEARALIDAYNVKRDRAAELLGLKGGVR
jgi:hypothetical protein